MRRFYGASPQGVQANGMKPRFGSPRHDGSDWKQKLAYVVSALVAGCLVWYFGYRYALLSAKSISLQTDGTVDALEVDQLVVGFKEKYPTYQLKGADDGSNVDEAAEEAVSIEEKLATSPDSQDDPLAAADDTEIEVQKIEQEAKKEEEETSGIYVDQAEYDAAPYIQVPALKPMPKGLWWCLRAYEKYYQIHPIKAYVPRMKKNIQITEEMFFRDYIRHGQPVIFSFENLRNLGFTTKSYTMEQLQELFPYHPSKDTTEALKEFVANGVRTTDAEIDLGPAIASVMRDEQLSKKGKLRNFPRNLKVKESAIQKLGVEKPPLLKDMTKFQLPTVWMGTSSSDTRFHHDCCDNFVMMVSGTKRFTLAPTTDWRTLNPTCVGAHKSLCWANVAHPNSPTMTPRVKKTMSKIHKIVVDIAPGEILYMPAGWFHHIQNLGPTVMVNWWTRGAEQVGLLKAIKDKAV